MDDPWHLVEWPIPDARVVAHRGCGKTSPAIQSEKGRTVKASWWCLMYEPTAAVGGKHQPQCEESDRRMQMGEYQRCTAVDSRAPVSCGPLSEALLG